MTSLTPWGDPIPERAESGVSKSPITRERTSLLWNAVLDDLRRQGARSQAALYLDLDYSALHSSLTGRELLLACKAAFYGRAPLPIGAAAHLDTLPPRRTEPAPSVDGLPEPARSRLLAGRSAEGIGPDGTDHDHWRLED